MNDFSELENELKKLRPASASSGLSQRVERALLGQQPATPTADVIVRPQRFQVRWLPLGLGLAAAATFLLLARVEESSHRTLEAPAVAQGSPGTLSPELKGPGAFAPAGLTQVVYNQRDEGLGFRNGEEEPVRRMRRQTRETLQWQNPQTGASLRVSYPAEEVMLIPVSGQ